MNGCKTILRGPETNGLSVSHSQDISLLGVANKPIKIDFKKMERAQKLWMDSDRFFILSAALNTMTPLSFPKPVLESCADILRKAQSLMTPQTLPGPTGELNRLSFHPRGKVLMLADLTGGWNVAQLFKCLATGNSVIIAEPESRATIFSRLFSLLKKAGMPNGLVIINGAQGGAGLSNSCRHVQLLIHFLVKTISIHGDILNHQETTQKRTFHR